MSEQKPKPIDLTDKVAAQLYLNDKFLAEGDFIGPDGKYREYKMKITAVVMEELQLPGRKEKVSKVVLSFDGAKKRLVANKTNVVAIKSHYGKHVKDWIGQFVDVFFNPHVKFGKKTTGGVRIRAKEED